MDFNMTEDQQMFVKLAKDFGEKRLAPTITERDHQGILMKQSSKKCSKWVWAAHISQKNTAELVPMY